MTKTRLFIEDVEVELNSQVQFLLNQQFTDISDPATIFNDWSKTVDIPFTSNNNELFGHLYSEDRLISVSNNPDDPLTGIYFDPNKKLRFRLEWNGVLLMSGYAKTNSVTRTLTSGSYNITLNGELGRVFQELDKITMDLAKLDTDEYKYVLDTREKVNFLLNKETIYQAWNNEGQKHVSIDDTEIEWTDIVGFAPSNAFDENFDSKSILELNDDYNFEIRNISDTLPEVIQSIKTDSIIGNGLSPLSMKQFRSYNQIPFVFINKLFQMFIKKANNLTGYDFELDESWFNTANPYWYDTVCVLKKNTLNPKLEQSALLKISLYHTGPDTDEGVFDLEFSTENYEIFPFFYENTMFTARLPFPYKIGPIVDIVQNRDFGHINFSFKALLCGNGTGLIPGSKIYGKSIYYADLNIINENNEVIRTIKYAFVGQDHNYEANNPNADFVVTVEGVTESQENGIWLPFNVPISGLPTGQYHFSIDFHWDMIQQEQYKLIYNGAPSNPSMKVEIYDNIASELDLYTAKFYKDENYLRTNSIFNINKYWNNEVSPWQFLLKYLKMNHIIIEIDSINKKIKLVPYYMYFYNIIINDYTGELDTKKNIIITPNRPNEKNLMYDYDKTELELFKRFEEKNGVSYGGIRVNTNNNFNTNTKRFMEGLKPIGDYSPSFVSYYDGLINNNVEYITPSIMLSLNVNKENKLVDTFGSIYFYKGKVDFLNTSIKPDTYYITDDLTHEMIMEKSVYHALFSTDETKQNMYNQLNLQTNKYSQLNPIHIDMGGKWDVNLWFNIPLELYFNYTDINNNILDTKSLYKEFWELYISELYNPQNKQVTAYLRLTPKDYMDLKINKFIQIKNQLYLVNKVCDYDMTNTESTKCELITIQNINNYKRTTLKYWGIDPYLREVRTNQWSGTVFNDYKITGWNHENKTFTLVDVRLDGQSVGNNWTKVITVTDTDTPSLYNLTFNVAPPVSLIIQPGQQKVLTFTIEDSDGEQRTATIILRNPNIASESSEIVDD